MISENPPRREPTLAASSDAMKILLAHPLPVQRSRLQARMRSTLGLAEATLANDLTETFNAAEHSVPDVVLIADLLAQRPEFEVLKALFDALGIHCVLIADPTGTNRRGGSPTLAALPVLSEASSDDEWREALRKGLSPTRGQTMGVQRRAQAAAAFDSRKVILIGSSTGGVDALIRVLRVFPENCPPTLIVQHTGDGFADGLIRVLARESAAKVVEAVHGRPVAPGHVYMAIGKRHHLKLASSAQPRIHLEESAPISGHRPSVDALFRSMLSAPRNAVAALLTGMGRDGAEGITELRRAGAFTIGQDQASSVVYGMPRVAHEMGGICVQLPIERIGNELLKMCKVGAT